MERRGNRRSPPGSPQPNFSGQHRLIDQHVVEFVIRAAAITPTDLVIDIGAGRGAIAFRLAERAREVLAVEYDGQMVRRLETFAPMHQNLHVVHEDVLRWKLPREPFCVVANIPFAITTPILRRLLDPITGLQRAAIIVELAAARRFTAKSIRDPLVLTWHTWFELSIAGVVSRDRFFPRPRVDGAVLVVRRRHDALVADRYYVRFHAFAAHGLRRSGATLADAWRSVFTSPQLVRALRLVGKERHEPVSALSPEQWGVLFNCMLEHVPSAQWPVSRSKFGTP